MIPGMDTITLFETALDIRSPWSITACEFSAEAHQLVLRMEFAEGSRFTCPTCQAAGYMVHDTRPQRWRYLDFFQHRAFIEAQVPRVRCEACNIVRMVDVPWARRKTAFTSLVASCIMESARHMPVLPLARLIGGILSAGCTARADDDAATPGTDGPGRSITLPARRTVGFIARILRREADRTPITARSLRLGLEPPAP